MTTRPIRIAPSILSADFARLGEEITALDAAGADYFHVDIMDGHFVPNISFGPMVMQSIRKLTAKPFDVHLMIAPADPYIAAFARAGADSITVHAEAGPHLQRTLQAIKAEGKKAGVALNPGNHVNMELPNDIAQSADIDFCRTGGFFQGFGDRIDLEGNHRLIERGEIEQLFQTVAARHQDQPGPAAVAGNPDLAEPKLGY